jgi:hypothetical protein
LTAIGSSAKCGALFDGQAVAALQTSARFCPTRLIEKTARDAMTERTLTDAAVRTQLRVTTTTGYPRHEAAAALIAAPTFAAPRVAWIARIARRSLFQGVRNKVSTLTCGQSVALPERVVWHGRPARDHAQDPRATFKVHHYFPSGIGCLNSDFFLGGSICKAQTTHSGKTFP